MIQRVYRRVEAAASFSRIIVLTDDERIARLVESFGGEVEMTPSTCASGTDRIAHAARNWEDAAIVNVQGDEPLIEPEALEQLSQHLSRVPEDPVVTLAAAAAAVDLDNPDVVKVVTDRRGYALYFSRAPIPFPRRPESSQPLRHIGVYGYQRRALLEIAAREPTPLERTESLEQLRMLENGVPIRVLETAHAWPGVDTMEDLQRLEEMISKRKDIALD
jgi:3-deoxy-manno-octulosonate cytidylyltransferase (CMP-KDO synthetase)